MLLNGLGELLSEQVQGRARFFDLFCGAGSVASHVAQNFPVKVFACDLQKYAAVLVASQIERTTTFFSEKTFTDWTNQAELRIRDHGGLWERALEASKLFGSNDDIREQIEAARSLCAEAPDLFPITKAYGGYYYSPAQTIFIDALRASLPLRHKNTALASLISAASTCAASPGHTAQPFSTKDTALPHLCGAWRKDLKRTVKTAFEKLADNCSIIKGKAVQLDALSFSKKMKDGDVAFIDPPYSEVQYSRFYHVLESIATGDVGLVSGVGRYPSILQRPQSEFCLVTKSTIAFKELMKSVSEKGAEAIVTFPAGVASNGLSGSQVEEISDMFFQVRKRKITSTFSTLGGNALTRTARKTTTELVLYLAPK